MRPSVVLSVALASCLVAGAALAQTPARSCVRVEVSSEVPGASPSRSAVAPNVLVPTTPSFSATQILDLTFTVLFPTSLSGEHVVELRVTPDSSPPRRWRAGRQPGLGSGGYVVRSPAVAEAGHAGAECFRGRVDDVPGGRDGHRVVGAVRPVAGGGVPRRCRAAVRPGGSFHPEPLIPESACATSE
jgi:hypothetical protein